MRLLISIKDEDEAVEALTGGADIIDIKNPAEGSLGASFPWVIIRVKQKLPLKILTSIALGDLPYLPGTISLAARGAATYRPDFLKIGLFGTVNARQAMDVLLASCRAVRDVSSSTKIIAAGYGDYEHYNSLDPSELPQVARAAGADGVMIDLREKNAGSLIQIVPNEKILNFTRKAHEYGLIVGLAGSLRKEDIQTLAPIGADIIGFRTGACRGDRLSGRIARELVSELVCSLRKTHLDSELAIPNPSSKVRPNRP